MVGQFSDMQVLSDLLELLAALPPKVNRSQGKGTPEHTGTHLPENVPVE